MKERIINLATRYEACRIGVEPEALRAFIDVESGRKKHSNGNR